jgi:hypothetical protein
VTKSPLTYAASLKDSDKNGGSGHRYLLLGNGFSIGLLPEVFAYKSLLKEANFSDDKLIKSVFSALQTSDFEHVVRALNDASKIVGVYEAENTALSESLSNGAQKLKDLLVSTITKNHPLRISDIDPDRFKRCNSFLTGFGKIYTLNYDLLLYWTLLSARDGNYNDIDDGFRNTDYEMGADYRTFDSPHSPTFWYLHGGLHLFDAGSQVRKYTWSDTGAKIIDQVTAALNKGLFPLFVSEGTAEEKLTKINHSAYLSKALRSFESICDQKNGHLFILGHSLGASDSHISRCLEKGKIGRCYVGLYRESEKHDYPKDLIARLEAIQAKRHIKRPLEIVYFDSNSADPWGLNRESKK